VAHSHPHFVAHSHPHSRSQHTSMPTMVPRFVVALSRIQTNVCFVVHMQVASRRRALLQLSHLPPRRLAFSTESAGSSTFHKFDAAAKAEVFRNVFDGGLPMWEKLGEEVDKALTAPPSKVLSVGDWPGEPGCYFAARYGCPTISSDSVAPMVAAAQKRAHAKGLSNVECMLLDMQDLSAIEPSSCRLRGCRRGHGRGHGQGPSATTTWLGAGATAGAWRPGGERPAFRGGGL
jgi:hypothetical protein